MCTAGVAAIPAATIVVPGRAVAIADQTGGQTMRSVLIALSLLLGTAIPAAAQVSVSVTVPGISIGIHQHGYPELVLVPGYPVYYAPQLPVNYFFYDGYYWLYHEDHWYMSDWYDGPWTAVNADDVPLFVLRVPVRYYVNPPVHFYGWYVDAAPRWDYHWGPRWVYYRQRWDYWDRHIVYAPAPLPLYQRHYVGDRYPRGEYRHVIHREHYRYQPRDSVVRERHHRQHAAPRPQTHARDNFPRSPQREHERERERSWYRTPGMPAQPQAVPRQPAAVPQQPAAVPQQPAMVPAQPRAAPAPHHRFQSAPRERGEFRGSEAQRAAPGQSGPAPQAVQPRPQRELRAERAPRPQFQQRAPQMGGEAQPRGSFERRPGPERQGRGGERGPGRN